MTTGIPVTVDTAEEKRIKAHIIERLKNLIVVGLEVIKVLKHWVSSTEPSYLNLFSLDILEVVFGAMEKEGLEPARRTWVIACTSL